LRKQLQVIELHNPDRAQLALEAEALAQQAADGIAAAVRVLLKVDGDYHQPGQLVGYRPRVVGRLHHHQVRRRRWIVDDLPVFDKGWHRRVC
jgi:hypothetical protein